MAEWLQLRDGFAGVAVSDTRPVPQMEHRLCIIIPKNSDIETLGEASAASGVEASITIGGYLALVQ